MRYRAIYKCTTIDPPYTIRHAIDAGAEIMRPKQSFFKMIESKGFPNRLYRFCCDTLKEYKVLDKVVIGVRRAESVSRNSRYTEPTQCRWYGSRKNPENHVEQIFPILDWTDDDVKEFIEDRCVVLHPLYYREDGSIDIKKRLGCVGCPIKYNKKRIEDFKKYPRLVRIWCRKGQIYLDTHPDSKTAQRYKDAYHWFWREVMFDKEQQYQKYISQQMFDIDYKKELENTFNITL